MIDTLLGFKQKMGAVYINDRRYPVTWVKVDPCIVTQVKQVEKDNYMAIQLGIGSKKGKNLTKPQIGHLKKTTKNENLTPRFLREVKINEGSNLKVGDEIKIADVFKKGDKVTVTGVSKGKGFAGVVKRWRFAGGPKTHGQSDRERAPGSIGQRTTPGRVYKGKRMAGRMGQDRVTVKGLTLLDIDETNNTITIKGPVPGATGGLVYVRKTGEGEVKVELPVTESLEDEKVDKVDQKEQVKELEQVVLKNKEVDDAKDTKTNEDKNEVESTKSEQDNKTDNQ
jgi:large subunit ribosomal protein L3